jgi:hypothetical protein
MVNRKDFILVIVAYLLIVSLSGYSRASTILDIFDLNELIHSVYGYSNIILSSLFACGFLGGTAYLTLKLNNTLDKKIPEQHIKIGVLSALSIIVLSEVFKLAFIEINLVDFFLVHDKKI